jgi:hypothetical protein
MDETIEDSLVVFSVNVGTVLYKDPRTFLQASASPDWPLWYESMRKEYFSLSSTHNAWKVVPWPVGKSVLRSMWVLKTKRDAAGRVEKLKARVVAVGSSQKKGVDYDEVFAPVVGLAAVRVLLAIAAHLGLSLRHADIEGAFLHGDLDREVHMRPPPGFHLPPGMVLLLLRSIYGLKQSPRIFNLDLHSHLISMGFTRCPVEPCLYWIVDGENYALLAFYVDDSIGAVDPPSYWDVIVAGLRTRFLTEDRGQLVSVLGMLVSPVPGGGWKLDQRGYVHVAKLLSVHGLEDCKSSKSPMAQGFLPGQGAPADKEVYAALVGCLLWVGRCTRPDISDAVRVLSRRVASPTTSDFKGLHRVLAFLKGTQTSGLVFSPGGSFSLGGDCDADWGGS